MNLTKKSFILVIFSLAFAFNGCKNDLKLNAPYKEVPTIYAMLNPQEKIQMVRVNKVFLGEGDANQMAQVADSINYQPGDLTVTLDRYVNGTHVDACPTCTDAASLSNKKTITFRDSMITAVKGAFNTNQRVYVTGADLHDGPPFYPGSTLANPNWKAYGDYVLTVKNNKTGNVFTSKATAVDSVSGNQIFKPLSPPYYPYNVGTDPKEFIDYSNLNSSFNVSFVPKDGKVNQLVIRFHFYEVLFNTQRVYRYADYIHGNLFPKDLRKLNTLAYYGIDFKGKDVYTALGLELSRMGLSDQVAGRKMYRVEYLVYSSTQDYVDYLQFTAPSFNISQTKPLYSNFENRAALGIFTFKSRCSVVKEMSNAFISSFSDNPNTCKYKFYTATDEMRGCP